MDDKKIVQALSILEAQITYLIRNFEAEFANFKIYKLHTLRDKEDWEKIDRGEPFFVTDGLFVGLKTKKGLTSDPKLTCRAFENLCDNFKNFDALAVDPAIFEDHDAG